MLHNTTAGGNVALLLLLSLKGPSTLQSHSPAALLSSSSCLVLAACVLDYCSLLGSAPQGGAGRGASQFGVQLAAVHCARLRDMAFDAQLRAPPPCFLPQRRHTKRAIPFGVSFAILLCLCSAKSVMTSSSFTAEFLAAKPGPIPTSPHVLSVS